jgi:hypothetical protein
VVAAVEEFQQMLGSRVSAAGRQATWRYRRLTSVAGWCGTAGGIDRAVDRWAV